MFSWADVLSFSVTTLQVLLHLTYLPSLSEERLIQKKKKQQQKQINKWKRNKNSAVSVLTQTKNNALNFDDSLISSKMKKLCDLDKQAL